MDVNSWSTTAQLKLEKSSSNWNSEKGTMSSRALILRTLLLLEQQKARIHLLYCIQHSTD